MVYQWEAYSLPCLIFLNINIFQGAYSPYLSQHYQVYSVPGADNTGLYSYGLPGHPPRNHAYASVPNYMVPGQHIVQFGGQNLNGATTSAIQAPYPAGSHCWNALLPANNIDAHSTIYIYIYI